MLFWRARASCRGPFACLLVMVCAAHARADASVELRESVCREAPLEQVMPALRVELREQLDESGTGEHSYRLYGRCEDDVLTVRAVAPDGEEQTFETRLEGTSDDVRARVVALAIAEIARDLPDPAEPPAVPPPAPLPSPASAPRAQEPASAAVGKAPAQLTALGQGSVFAANGTWLGGAGLGMSYHWSRLVVGLHAVLLTGHHDVSAGSARAFVAYAQPELAYAHAFDRSELRAGAAFALGRTILDGRAEDRSHGEASVRTAFLAPALFAQADRELTPRLSLLARLELGIPLVTAIGQIPGAKDMQIRGAWLSVRLGASYAFAR